MLQGEQQRTHGHPRIHWHVHGQPKGQSGLQRRLVVFAVFVHSVVSNVSSSCLLINFLFNYVDFIQRILTEQICRILLILLLNSTNFNIKGADKVN